MLLLINLFKKTFMNKKCLRNVKFPCTKLYEMTAITWLKYCRYSVKLCPISPIYAIVSNW